MQKSLNNLEKPRALTQTIAITGGKGGVGKTNIAINLAMALECCAKEVILLDADFGLANVGVLLGLSNTKTINDVLKTRCALKEAIVNYNKKINIITAASGDPDLANMDYVTTSELIDVISNYESPPDYLLIDTASGISSDVLGLINACHEILIIVCNEPGSFADAYALIKVLNQTFGINRFQILINKITSQRECLALFNKLYQVTDRFLCVKLNLLGSISLDKTFITANCKRKTLSEFYPPCRAVRELQIIADKICNLRPQASLAANKKFFDQQYMSQVID